MSVPRRHYKMAAVSGDRRRIHLVRSPIARHSSRTGLPVDPVISGVSHVRSGSSAVPRSKDNVRIRLGEIDSIVVRKRGIAIHAASGRLVQVGVAHPRDVPKRTEENSPGGGGVHIGNRLFLNAVIFKNPGHASWLGSRRDIGTVPNPAAGRVNGVGGIEGVNSDIPLPTHSSRFGAAK